MEIKSVVAKEDNGNVQITFTIPFPLIKKSQDDAVAEMAKDTEIPGFRKGKAPLAKVREKIPENSLIEHSLGHILPKALGEAITEHKLKLALYPKWELVSSKSDEDWQIRGITCELPEVNLGDYKSIVAGELRAGSLKKELAKEEKEQVVIKALLTNIKINIPAVLIEEEANNRLSNLLSRLEKLGLALESYLASINKTAADIRAEYATQAKDAISLDLILSRVAQSENIKVSQKEIDEALKAADSTQDEERKRLAESILKRRMALEFLSKLA
jgi:FKBP-type peptidyl-prolyl cis-trans isomerase (trigger factor)